MRTAAKNWKSSLAGIVTLALAGVAAYRNPSVMGEPGYLGMVMAGLGLIVSQDGKPDAPPTT